MVVVTALGQQQYNIGEKPTVILYTCGIDKAVSVVYVSFFVSSLHGDKCKVYSVMVGFPPILYTVDPYATVMVRKPE